MQAETREKLPGDREDCQQLSEAGRAQEPISSRTFTVSTA